MSRIGKVGYYAMSMKNKKRGICRGTEDSRQVLLFFHKIILPPDKGGKTGGLMEKRKYNFPQK